jgi:hypothetical protein
MQISTIEQTPKTDEVCGFDKGREFEDFIVTLFNKRKFRLLEWRSDKKASNGVLPLSCSFPDLEFDYTRGKSTHRFAVECKWRKQFYSGSINWADQKQIDIYTEYQFQNAISVYVAIGIGGIPKNPEQLYITPLDHIKMYPQVFRSRLIRYRRNPLQQLEPSEQLPLFKELD